MGRGSTLWRTRRHVRKVRRFGRNLRRANSLRPATYKGFHIYKDVDEFAEAFFPDFTRGISKQAALARVKEMIGQLGYSIVEQDEKKPWGGMYRMPDEEAGQFIHDFFPGLTLDEARLGRDDVRLSPKFLLIAPGTRLSWQYHNRRAERWHFLTNGSYTISETNDQPAPTAAPAGTIVQLSAKLRHRVASQDDSQYVLVAEIWQHVDPRELSDENDIIRIQDDFKRI